MKRLKLSVLHTARLLGMFGLARFLTARGVRILCYHGVWLGNDGHAGDTMFMSRAAFEGRLALISQLNYPVVSLGRCVDALRGTGEVPAAPVVITIDDGWFSIYDAMVPALRHHGMAATLYCDTAHVLGGKPIAHMMARHIWRLAGPAPEGSSAQLAYVRAIDPERTVDARTEATGELASLLGANIADYTDTRAFDYMTPDELRQTLKSGVDIQLHTHNHTLHDMSGTAIREEIETNRRALAQVLDKKPEDFQHFCYPSGVTSTAAARALEELGIASSTTARTGLTYPGEPMQLLPRFLDGGHLTLIEFEAELSGFMTLVRNLRERVRSLLDLKSGASVAQS